MREKIRKPFGFTLIELLVAITIIAILGSLALGNYQTSLKRGRDAQRRSDLNQYRIALENYAANNNGKYPASGDGESCGNNGIFQSLGPLIPTYLPAVIHDPKENCSVPGDYYTSRITANRLTYILEAHLESETGAFWQICSNGKVGKIICGGSVTCADPNCDL